jgi:hypothetical protein
MEIYGQIIKHLTRDDLKALRLTCKEIEFRITKTLLQTVVVPFNTEVYDLLHRVEEKSKPSDLSTLLSSHRLGSTNPDSLNGANGHGVDVFRGFGHHIKRFGMSFEVTEGI